MPLNNPESISITPFAVAVANVGGSDVDVVALGNARLAAIGSMLRVAAARRVVCGTGGTVIVKLATDPATGLSYTNVPNNGPVEGQIVALATGTTATNMIVEF